MAATDTPAPGAGPATPPRPYPAGIATLIDDRPLLWYEQPGEYDALRASVFAELPLKDPLDYVLGKDFVDLLWEQRRMARLTATAVNFTMPVATSKLIEFGAPGLDDKARAEVERAADHVASGRDWLRARGEPLLEARMREERVTPEMLHLLCRVGAATRLELIARESERIEIRTHRLLKDIEARSLTLAAMAKSLVERERARAANSGRVN